MESSKVLELLGSFTWMWDDKFFIETAEGNFIWRDPNYPGGDNTIKSYDGSLKQYCRKTGIPFGRDKGKHFLKNYCRHYKTGVIAQVLP